MRECEKDGINGVVWYLVGVLWVLKLYPRDVAVVSILMFVPPIFFASNSLTHVYYFIVSPGPIQPRRHSAGYMVRVRGPSPPLFAYPFYPQGSTPCDSPGANLSLEHLARLALVPLSLLGFGAGVGGQLEVMGRRLCGCGMKPHGEA